MFKSKTTLFVVVIVLILIVVGVGVWIGTLFANGNGNTSGPSPYAAVYLMNGGVYFGKLSWFPTPHMTDVFYLQQTQGTNGQSQLGIAAFTQSPWQPVDEIYLNTQQIAFWSYLQNGSQLAAQLANPAAAQQAAQQQQGAGTPSTSASSTSTDTTSTSGK